MKKAKIQEAMLVMVTGFLLLYIIYDNVLLLYLSFGIGLTSIFIKPLAKLIAQGWYKLGDLLGFVVSKVVLSLMFYIFLMPIALLHNLFNKDILKLKKTNQSAWSIRNHKYSAADLKNIW